MPIPIYSVQLSQHRYLFFGAGEAGVGIADLLSSAVAKQAGATVYTHIYIYDRSGHLSDVCVMYALKGALWKPRGS